MRARAEGEGLGPRQLELGNGGTGSWHRGVTAFAVFSFVLLFATLVFFSPQLKT